VIDSKFFKFSNNHLQESYLVIDKLNYKFNETYINGTAWFSNTPDGKKGIFGFESRQSVTFVKEKARFDLRHSLDEYDVGYSKQVIATTVDLCKLYAGLNTKFIRVAFQDLLKNLSTKLACPVPKGTVVRLENATFDERAFPTNPDEHRLKLRVDVSGVAKKQRGWMSMWSIEVYFRYHRLNFFKG
jgi:hypothetical protein